MKQSRQAGQIIVLLLLIMLVGLTIGLSITSRTLQQMKITSVSEQSSRAYSGAEAAIEAALKEDLSTVPAGWHSAGDLGSSVLLEADVRYMVEEEDEFILTVQRDEVAQVNLQGFTGNQMDIYWVDRLDDDENPAADPARASLEVTFIKNEAGSYSLIRFALNADNRPGNGFTQPGGGTDSSDGVEVTVWGTSNCGSAGTYGDYCNKAEIINLPGSELDVLRIKPFYNKATVWVTSGDPIPTQLYTVSGEATTVADVTRRVEVVKAPPALPPIFDYVLFDGSGNALRK